MRIRQNFFTSTLTANLTTTTTSMQVALLTTFPAITGTDVAYFIIDPAGPDPEIVKMTAHTAAADTGTIVRGQEGTSDPGVTWPAGTVVMMAPLISDLMPRQGAGNFTGSDEASLVGGYTDTGNGIYSTGRGSVAFGYAEGVQTNLIGTGNRGAFALGAVYGFSADAYVRAGAPGSFAVGNAYNGKIKTTGSGAIAMGGVSGQLALIHSADDGSFAGGYAYTDDPAATARLYSAAEGSFVFGRAYVDSGGDGTADITADFQGAWAGGTAFTSTTTGASSRIYADGRGSLAHGYAWAYGAFAATITANSHGGMAHGIARAYDAAASIYVDGKGAFGFGYSHGYGGAGLIRAQGNGSFAGGYVTGGAEIKSVYHGTFAFGYSAGTDIIANANNCAQFGPGTNALADSLSVGTGPRLKGTTGAPGTPRNGDVWVASNYVYVRSNGVSVKIV